MSITTFQLRTFDSGMGGSPTPEMIRPVSSERVDLEDYIQPISLPSTSPNVQLQTVYEEDSGHCLESSIPFHAPINAMDPRVSKINQIEAVAFLPKRSWSSPRDQESGTGVTVYVFDHSSDHRWSM